MKSFTLMNLSSWLTTFSELVDTAVESDVSILPTRFDRARLRDVQKFIDEALGTPLPDVDLDDAIAMQAKWIFDHGLHEEGYVLRYGSKNSASRYGNGGEAIYAADMAEFTKLLERKHAEPVPTCLLSVSEAYDAAQNWDRYVGNGELVKSFSDFKPHDARPRTEQHRIECIVHADWMRAYGAERSDEVDELLQLRAFFIMTDLLP